MSFRTKGKRLVKKNFMFFAKKFMEEKWKVNCHLFIKYSDNLEKGRGEVKLYNYDNMKL